MGKVALSGSQVIFSSFHKRADFQPFLIAVMQKKVSMEQTFPVDSNKLNDVLEDPDLEREFQEVFSFVENITGQKPHLTDLTPGNITTWNEQFDAVLKKLFNTEGGMGE